MPHAQLVVKDQCNIKFNGLELELRQLLTAALRYEVPNARFTPQYKLGRWDGTVSFCTATSGTYFNLLDRLLPIVYSHGYDIEIDDRRPVYSFRFDHITDDIFADKTWPPGHDMAGEPIMLRDYQVEAINAFLDHLQSVQEIATGSGKTVMCAALSYLCQQYGRTIVIVPSKSLVLQTEEDYRNVGLDVGVYYGKRKELDHTHTIATWQSLGVLDKNSRRDEAEIPIAEIVKDVICVIGDECLDGSTTILTPNGWVPIFNLQAGDAVINRNDAGEFKTDVVVKVYENLPKSHSEKMYELLMDDGSMLHITGNHEVLTRRGFVRADELTENDDIVSYC